MFIGDLFRPRTCPLEFVAHLAMHNLTRFIPGWTGFATPACSATPSTIAAGARAAAGVSDGLVGFSIGCECNRLLKPGAFLVMNETVAWFEGVRRSLPSEGFQIVGRHLLPRHCWWTDYYAPLEQAIRGYKDSQGDTPDSAELARYEREVAMVKADPSRFDCGFFILQKQG